MAGATCAALKQVFEVRIAGVFAAGFRKGGGVAGNSDVTKAAAVVDALVAAAAKAHSEGGDDACEEISHIMLLG